MSYPGDRGLDPVVQQRIMTAFGEAVRLYREGHGEECRTILRSILEIDPVFAPAQRLGAAVASGKPVDLGELLGQVTAVAEVRPEEYLGKAREAMASRDFAGAIVMLQELLRELPGHAEGRALLAEAQERARVATEVAGYLERTRQALAVGMREAAESFLAAAAKLDPAHPELPDVQQAVRGMGGHETAAGEFEFGVEEPVPAAPNAMSVSADSSPAVAEAEPEAGVAEVDAGGVPGASAFEPVASEFIFAAAEDAGGARGADARIAALLEDGQAAFDRGDFAAAIDTWSRIYLVDPQHAEASHRIEEARRRREETERAAEHRFYEARDAFEEGRLEDARRLCQEVLQLQPQHLDAHDLLQRLETPAAPPPPPMPAADTEGEDLFRDDFVPARTPASGAVPVARASAAAVPRREAAVRRPAPARVAGLPIPVVAAIGGALVLLLAVAFLLRGKLLGGGDGEILAGLAEAEKLASQGQYQQAVTLLQSLEVEGEAANQVRQRLLEYQRQLRSTKTPSVPTEATLAREALASGARVKALTLIRQGLAKVPGDKELQALMAEITAVSPVLPALADGVAARDWEAVRQQAAALLQTLPGDEEAQRLWAAATFNLAVTWLRKYQVAAAYGLLQELGTRRGDREVERLKEFADSYRSRPIDPRYQIFVANIELRPLE